MPLPGGAGAGRRDALADDLDPPGSPRAGSTADDLLRPLDDAAVSTKRTPIAFSVNPAGDTLEPGEVKVTLTPC